MDYLWRSKNALETQKEILIIPNMKKHIVIEGIHGSGKTSIAKALTERLTQA